MIEVSSSTNECCVRQKPDAAVRVMDCDTKNRFCECGKSTAFHCEICDINAYQSISNYHTSLIL